MTNRVNDNSKQENELIVALASIKLTLLLLTTLMIMSIWGTLAPKMNVYYSPIYITNLVMIGLNLSVCSFRRMHRLKWRLTQRNLGYILTHAGILIILLGSTVSLLGGFRYPLWLSKGDMVNRLELEPRGDDPAEIVPLGFDLTLKKFHLKLHPSGMPDAFLSDVSITDPDGNSRDAVISVNGPLKKNGLSFYQSSYRVSIRQPVSLLLHTDENEEPRELTVVVNGDSLPITGSGCESLQIRGIRYEPDFVMGGPGQIGSRSILPNNPAVLIEVRCDEKSPETQWLFMRHRNTHSSGFESGIHLSFNGVDQEYDTGLEVVRDPGSVWVALGALLLIAGLLFYLIPLKKTGAGK